jgi:hypothetical protein
MGGEAGGKESGVESDETRVVPEEESGEARVVPEPRWSLFRNRRLEAWRFESDTGGEAGGKESEVESEEA